MNKQRFAKLQAHTDWLVSAFTGLRLNYGLLKPILGDQEAGIPHPPPRVLYPGLGAVRNTLFRSCVLDLVNLAWDKDDRAPSVTRLVEGLRESEVVSCVMELHTANRRDPSDDEDEQVRRHRERIADSNAEWRREQVKAQINDLEQEWAALDEMPAKAHFMAMRDKHIAHLEVRPGPGGAYESLDLGSLGVKRRDLSVALARMEAIVWLLNTVLRDADFQMSQATKMFDLQGEQFWKPFIGGSAS